MRKVKKILNTGLLKRQFEIEEFSKNELSWEITERWVLKSKVIKGTFIIDFLRDKLSENDSLNISNIIVKPEFEKDKTIANLQMRKGNFDIKIENFWTQFDINMQQYGVLKNDWIRDLNTFNNKIQKHEELTILIHSNWSASSVLELQKFADFCKDYKDVKLVIENSDAKSFIYTWLKEQKEKLANNNNFSSEDQKKRWIHGNGEIFKVKNGVLVAFKDQQI